MENKILDIHNKIHELCKEEKKSEDICKALSLSLDEVENLISVMLKQGRLEKLDNNKYKSVTGFKKVTLEQWRAMGLPEEIDTISFKTKKDD